MGDVLTRLMLGGFVRMHVLYHAAREPVFGIEMMEELGRHGYQLGAGILYPILHQLEEVGYALGLKRSVGNVSNKPKRRSIGRPLSGYATTPRRKTPSPRSGRFCSWQNATTPTRAATITPSCESRTPMTGRWPFGVQQRSETSRGFCDS